MGVVITVQDSELVNETGKFKYSESFEQDNERISISGSSCGWMNWHFGDRNVACKKKSSQRSGREVL